MKIPLSPDETAFLMTPYRWKEVSTGTYITQNEMTHDDLETYARELEMERREWLTAEIPLD